MLFDPEMIPGGGAGLTAGWQKVTPIFWWKKTKLLPTGCNGLDKYVKLEVELLVGGPSGRLDFVLRAI